MHALIIEDHALVALLLRDCLRDLGYESFDVADGETKAIEAAETKWPDLIIADDKLAEGTGAEAVKAIRLKGRVPVVFASAEPERLVEADPGAIVITKPFLISDLAEAVAAAVAQINKAGIE